MLTDMVKLTIKAAIEIKKAFEQFKKNNKEYDKIYEYVEELSDGLQKQLQDEAPIMQHDSVHTAIKSLKDVLVSTANDVNNCRNTNEVVQLFKAGAIASKLNRHTDDVKMKMLAVVVLSTTSTNKTVQNMGEDLNSFKQMVHKNFAALNKFFGISDITDDARSDNKMVTKKTVVDGSNRITHYHTWRQLESVIIKLSTNEDNTISNGSSSSVYKAEFEKKPVAIKKFHQCTQQVKDRFLHELNLMRKLQHGNVVELLGFCFEHIESSLVPDKTNYVRYASNCGICFVTKHMDKKSMAEVISKGNNQYVSWTTLFQIIQGIAKGIRYLHRQGVLHLDLKPENILFDDDMTPKINNFGRAKELKDGAKEITIDEKNLPGTEDYVAPELKESTNKSWFEIFFGSEHKASKKSDVYSFGVILLKTIGQTYAKSKNGRRPKSHEDWAKRMKETEELEDLFNPKRLTESERAAARWCVIVGLLCCLPAPRRRPHMWKVVEMLRQYTPGEDSIATSSRSQAKAGKKSQDPASTSDSMLNKTCNCDYCPHNPVSCEMVHAWMAEKTKKPANSRYWEHSKRWDASNKSLETALKDMEELKGTVLQNMADILQIEVTELNFLAKAYEQIVECWRVTRWVHAYSYFLEPAGNKRSRFDRLQEQARISLESLQGQSESEKQDLCVRWLEDLDAISNACDQLTDLTMKARQSFGELEQVIITNFQD